EVSLNRAAASGWPRAEVERQRWLCRANGDFREAERHLQSLLDLDPTDLEVLLALAQGYSNLDRPNMAEPLVSRVLRADPENGAAYYLRGRIWLQFQQADRAYKDLERALQLGENRYYYAPARVLMANALRLMGKVEDAYQLYKECRATDPENVRVLY